MQIVIDVADDGLISVSYDGQEPSTYESAEEAVEFVQGLLGGGDMEEPEAPMEPESEEEAMWNEEAARRPKTMGLMA